MGMKMTQDSKKDYGPNVRPPENLIEQLYMDHPYREIPEHLEDMTDGNLGSPQGIADSASFGHDFNRIPVYSYTETFSPAAQSCPLGLATPCRCPFGGICHNCPARVQTKLAISQPGDIYEQEADRVADRVMQMSEGPNQSQKEKKNEDEVQYKAKGSLSTDPDLGKRVQGLQGKGRPMPKSLRDFFEPRFGQDFNTVRVHTGPDSARLAQSINARSFTLGNNIVFNQGEYAPSHPEGRKLLAHELTHTIQHERSRTIQRKIKTKLVQIDDYLINKGINKNDFKYTFTGFFYLYEKVGSVSYKTQDAMILSDMLSSDRVFELEHGLLKKLAQKSLDDHINARKNIMLFASGKIYGFATGSKMRMNPKYWKKVGDEWESREGFKRMELYRDMFINPQRYEISCELGTLAPFILGIGSYNIAFGKIKGKDDWVTGDWVPGDAGWIKNEKFLKGTHSLGTEGLNIIYFGNKQFWAHTYNKRYGTMKEWIALVKEWGGKAKLSDEIMYPGVGLIKPK